MELLYLWIEDFRKIKQQAFNFSSELIFNIESNPDQVGQYEITVEINDAYENIFPSQIVNVTGIVGKNGSGKSTLMHCLKLIYGQFARLTSPIIISFLNTETKNICTYYYQKGGLNSMSPLKVILKAGEKVNTRYIIQKPKAYSIARLSGEKGEIRGLDFDFKNLTCAYLSNNFDSHREDIYSGVCNQSTNQKIENFLTEFVREIERKSKKKKARATIEIYPSNLKEFYRKELRNNIRFIAYANKRKTGNLPDIPRTIAINYNFEDYEYLLENTSEYPALNSEIILTLFHARATEELIKNKDKKKTFYDLLYLCGFYYSLRHNLFRTNHYSKGDFSSRISTLIKNSRNIFEDIRYALDQLIIEANTDTKSKLVIELLGPNLFSAILQADFDSDSTYENDLLSFSFIVNNNLWDLLNIIFEFQYDEETSFLDYTWRHGLSTGEEALLNHFSRLYEVKKKIKQKPLLLLIDEGDLYFHPQWQKNYIKYLMDGIQFIFPNNKVQLVLSTHSPFIVSDLPKQNLIFLVKDNYENCIVSQTEIHTETFGSNIHELFTNSFFLTDGLMGEYSRTFIEKLIEDIRKEKNIPKDKFISSYKNRIGIIGEQFIKTKILELVATKTDFNLIDEIIEDRTLELDMLKKIRNQKRDGKN